MKNKATGLFDKRRFLSLLQLARALWWELSFLGALAGALAGAGALAIGAVFARQVFEKFFVHVVLVLQAAQQSAAGSRNLFGIQRQLLIA